MNPAMFLLFFFFATFFIIAPVMFIFFYFKSFKNRAIILKEVGEDENDSVAHIIKYKNQNHIKLSDVIKFAPFSGLRPCKQFDSSYLVSVKDSTKLRDGIILYKQGENYRPTELRYNEEEKEYVLHVKDADNRKFNFQYHIMKESKRDEASVIKTGVVSFFVFLAFIGLISLLTLLSIMDDSARSAVIATAQTVVSS